MVKTVTTGGVNRLVLALELGLVVLLTFLFVRAIIAFTAPESLWTETPSTVIAADTASSVSSGTFNWSFDPFHRSAVAAPIDAGQTAPETSLNLKLTGLRAGEDGSALLQTPDNQQRAYSVGDEIISGVTLHSVSPEFIVLSLGGRLERLTFERARGDTLTAAVRAASGTKLSPQALFAATKLEVAIENGQRQGLRISSRNPSVSLTEFGLQDGDIITHVGGRDLTKGQPNVSAIMTTLQQSSSAELKLVRNGRPLTVKVGSQ